MFQQHHTDVSDAFGTIHEPKNHKFTPHQLVTHYLMNSQIIYELVSLWRAAISSKGTLIIVYVFLNKVVFYQIASQ